ncbi:16S rRNA (cytosine(1402)-N(4))-methyltransferase RsmH [Spiroplasma platyhelix]|uniref:Ribosomal RNA small subunit methyltransferase H n=1 Tax=Spiroplasma platyhelix PALS-1 TaxID=1276218 RepID=A0A846U8X0_9MOLU|nr:16S rRNA (cytosine(1402)-N(4))-methyltransferase RsmH [Spiroplasma platyhelix]MBE4703950.1 Ribosomal RNA small subunit methyltransferase H [Spiroplasma platyhelix PALS-1]NKE38323.1 16S rRNA (cytosine(1402)-N(4))-methyltransferase RsmH [Spiroplasma platyhelix PALS-1]UJB29208.1 S-adenosyl-methyltransferase MraW [Spiroplasma platyhelix PALS-1]
MKESLVHVPVMLKETIDFLQVKPDGIYVDCTLGRAGHSKAILENLTTGKLYAFDLDQTALNESKTLLKQYHDKYQLIQGNFINLQQELLKRNITKVDGIIYDLGISSPQVDEESRGFSYKKNAKLDMRMDQSQELTAWDIVNTYSYQDLKYIIKTYGEEQFASSIAKRIVSSRSKQEIETTEQLTDIIKKALPAKQLNKQHHPAKKTFQAIRIAVNNELNSLKLSLLQALNLLNPQGRIAVISFHSLEDRIVKSIFVQAIQDPQGEVYAKLPYTSNWKSNYQIITKKPIVPSTEEINKNPRARSAKLRVIEKIN